jgi:hypothetical protein
MILIIKKYHFLKNLRRDYFLMNIFLNLLWVSSLLRPNFFAFIEVDKDCSFLFKFLFTFKFYRYGLNFTSLFDKNFVVLFE